VLVKASFPFFAFNNFSYAMKLSLFGSPVGFSYLTTTSHVFQIAYWNTLKNS
jgi:hypothetical protein